MSGFSPTALTHLLVVSDVGASRDWYVRVLDASVYRDEGSSVVLQLADNGFLLVGGGEPTPDKPGVTMAPPGDLDTVSSEFIFRVEPPASSPSRWSGGGRSEPSFAIPTATCSRSAR